MLRIFIYMLFIIFLFQQINAQKTSDNSLGTTSNSREFQLSVFTGSSFLGPKSDIESNMTSSGFGDRSSRWLGLGGKNYPYTEKHPIFDIEASYYLAQKSGISLNFGLISNIEVKGYDREVGIGNRLFLKSQIWTVSLNYVYRSKNRRHSIFIGPSLFIHSVKDLSISRYQKSPKNSNLKLGAYLGYSLQILQKKHWFLALKTNYRWAPKSQIGPFVAIHKLGLATANPTIHSSEFYRTTVNLSCLNVGLHVGVRIYKD